MSAATNTIAERARYQANERELLAELGVSASPRNPARARTH